MKFLALAGSWIFFAFVSLAAGQSLPFQAPVQYSAQPAPFALATADFNGDGKVDMVTANTAGSVSIFLSRGDGTFLPPSEISLPGCKIANYAAAADFNHDGKADVLIFCVESNSLLVLPGAGDGTFGKPIVTTVSLYPLAGFFLFINLQPAVADFNGDRYPDIVFAMAQLASGNSSLQLYRALGNGDGTFAAPVALTELPQPDEAVLATGDFNRDGKPDLVVALGALIFQSGSSNFLSFLPGDGKGNFGPAQAISAPGLAGDSPFEMVAADFNGDGILDLAISGVQAGYVNSSQTNVPPSNLAVLLGKGDGTFTQSFSALEQGLAYILLPVSTSGMGPPDLVEILFDLNTDQPTSTVNFRKNQGGGTFGNPTMLTSTPPSQPAWAATVMDLTGSGFPDLVFTTLFLGTKYNLQTFETAGLPGNISVLLNSAAPPPPLSFSNANGASFVNGALAANSIASAFGEGLTPFSSPMSASTVPLPTNLGGVTVTVTDAAGTARMAPLFYASPKQINYSIPAGTANGPATISISGNPRPFSAQVTIASVAPGLFNVNGLAAGSAVQIVNGQQQSSFLTDCTSSACASVPVDVSGGQTFLVLYGTGIRGYSQGVSAAIGSIAVTPVYAGPQSVFVGEDQINIQLPASLAGAGATDVTLTVDGQASNPVKIQIQ